jgi:hypothetical protein
LIEGNISEPHKIMTKRLEINVDRKQETAGNSKHHLIKSTDQNKETRMTESQSNHIISSAHIHRARLFLPIIQPNRAQSPLSTISRVGLNLTGKTCRGKKKGKKKGKKTSLEKGLSAEARTLGPQR